MENNTWLVGNHKQRIEQIEDMVKKHFHFSKVFVFLSDNEENYNIHVTYDCIRYKWTHSPVDASDSDIIWIFQSHILDSDWNWDGDYALNQHTLIIDHILQMYLLNEAGYFFIRNTLYFFNLKTNEVKEIVDTDNIKHFTVGIDKYGDFDGLFILTEEHYYRLKDDGVIINPTWGK